MSCLDFDSLIPGWTSVYWKWGGLQSFAYLLGPHPWTAIPINDHWFDLIQVLNTQKQNGPGSFSAACIETSIHRHLIRENLLNNFHLNFLTFQVELFGSNRIIWASKRLNFVSMKYCTLIYPQKYIFIKRKVCFPISVSKVQPMKTLELSNEYWFQWDKNV